MTDASEGLSDFERDALIELVNLGVGQAAAGLREMVGEQVHLSVPSLSLVTRAQAIKILVEREPRRLVAVQQRFEGEISGQALLIFPEAKSLELVRVVVGGDLPLEDIIELEQEALAETGNIILNSCLGTIANLLARSLKMSLPSIAKGGGGDLLTSASVSASDVVMFLHIDFSVRRRDLQGYIALVMDMPSLVSLKALLAEFIARATGDAVIHVAD